MKRESLARIVLGLATGAAFGFLLHKGRASRHESIAGQLSLQDSSVVKIMATASAVGALGTRALAEMGRTELKVQPLNLGGIALGGTLFGTGMAILGYCPGTSLAAIGEGHRDAVAGALGMLGGALLFVKFHPQLKRVMEKGAMGRRTLPEATSTSPWLWVAGTAATLAAGAKTLDSRL